MRIRPARVSATNRSPFGAVLMRRGPLSPSANSSTLNAGDTRGLAEAGRLTMRDMLAAEGVAPGFGRSSGLIRRTVPGSSRRQSPKASCPLSVLGWAFRGPVADSMSEKAAAAWMYRVAVIPFLGEHGEYGGNNGLHPSGRNLTLDAHV